MFCRFPDSCRRYNKGECVETNFCMRKYKLDFLFDSSMIPNNKVKSQLLCVDSDGTDMEAFTRLSEIKDNIDEFVEDGNNLYIYSKTPGNGKTSWAIKLAQSYIRNNWPEAKMVPSVLFINVPKFLLELKSNISKESNYIQYIMEYISDTSLIVWDDIATKSATEFEHEHLLSLIDGRIYNGKSNIFTSNVLPNELTELLGGRLASRIINESENIEFNGKDKRGLSTQVEQ